MKIILIRHFRVGFKWKRWYNSAEYERDHVGYNTAAVVEAPLNVPFDNHRIVTSTMGRALETSRYIFKREPDLSDDALSEVPMKPFVNTKVRLPRFVWDVVGRLQWRLNMNTQPEVYRDSKKRVGAFIDKLIDERRDVILVCHGWVIKLIIAKLRSAGFRGPSPVYIRNGKPYVFELPATSRRFL